MISELECLLFNCDINIIGISEIYWNEESQWDIVLPSYKLYRNEQVGHIGAGLSLYIKGSIGSNRIEIFPDKR